MMRIAQLNSLWWRVGEVIGFVLAGYIIVNADVAHCFVFTNKAVDLLSTILTAALVDPDQDKCREKEPRDKTIQGLEVLPEEEGVRRPQRNPQPQHFWAAACFWSLSPIWQRDTSIRIRRRKRGKVVLLTLRLLLNIKTGGINFSAPPLIFDVMLSRGAGPLRICSQIWNTWLRDYSSSFIQLSQSLLTGQLVFEILIGRKSPFRWKKLKKKKHSTFVVILLN